MHLTNKQRDEADLDGERRKGAAVKDDTVVIKPSFACFGFLSKNESFGVDEARVAMEGGGSRVKLNA